MSHPVWLDKVWTKGVAKATFIIVLMKEFHIVSNYVIVLLKHKVMLPNKWNNHML